MQDITRLDPKDAFRWLTWAMAGTLVANLFYSIYLRDSLGSFVGMLGLGCLLAGAAAFVGGVLGFLFGIPRALQQSDQAASQADAPSQASAAQQTTNPASASGATRYGANTNLEQISDWLTKIIVGVGLTQASEIQTIFGNIVYKSAVALGGPKGANLAQSDVFVSALLLYSLVVGFIYSYLWTRVYLRRLLEESEQSNAIQVLAAQVSDVKESIENLANLDEQRRNDDLALNSTYRQLDSVQLLSNTELLELNNLIGKATTRTRVDIYRQAKDFRVDPKNAGRLEKVFPIFEALIASDKGNVYHQNHAELARAMLALPTPPFAQAKEAIEKAIHVRDQIGDTDFPSYERMRAICKIALDQKPGSNEPSSSDLRASILSDLRVAAGKPVDLETLMQDQLIAKWLKCNDLSHDDLKTPND